MFMRNSTSVRHQSISGSNHRLHGAAGLFALALLLAFSFAASAQPERVVQVLDGGGAGVTVHKPRTFEPALHPLEMSKDQALWAAIAFENAGLVRKLLKTGADPNKPEDLSQMTPLMAAETFPVASALIEKGASASARDRTGRTPLHYAVNMRDAASIIPILVQAGADVNARAEDAGRNTPLLFAVEKYLAGTGRDEAINASVIRVLVRLGADLNAADARGATPLAIAAKQNEPKLIRLLIDLGADPAKRLGNGRTPLDYAREANAHDAVRMLVAMTGKARRAN